MSKINPNQGRISSDAQVRGVGDAQINQSAQSTGEKLNVSDAVGQGFEAGLGGGAVEQQTVPTGGVSKELVETLAKLVDGAGIVSGDEAELGDVDIDVNEEALLRLPLGERGLRFNSELRRVFSGEDVEQQRGVTLALGSFRESLQWHQGGLATEVGPEILASATTGLVADIVQNASSDTILSTAQTSFEHYLNQLPVDVNALVQWVLRQSYLEATADLAFFADKVRFYNGVKKQIRKELERARNVLQNAGSGPDAVISPTFEPAEISDTYYGPQQGEDQTSVDELQAAAESAGLEEEEADPVRARYNELIAEWVAAPNVDVTHNGSNVSENGNNHSNKIDDSECFDVMWNQAGQGWADDVVRWFQNLEPAVQAAYVEQWQSEGLKFRGYAYETHWKNESYTSSEVRKLGPGEDPVSWLREEAQRCVKNTASGITQKDGGGSLKLKDFNFRIEPADVTVSSRPPKSDELLALEQELGIESASGASTYVDDPYVAGEPIGNKGHLETYIENMEQKLSSVGDDAQLANVDLQNMLQKQQQTLQLMSNISKMLHDTALAIIRKMG